MKPILLLGDLILDCTISLHPERLSPEDDGAIVARVVGRSQNLGGAGNVAANIKALGGIVRFFSAYGEATALYQLLHEAGLHDIVCVPHGWRHALKSRYVSEVTGRQLLRLDDAAVVRADVDPFRHQQSKYFAEYVKEPHLTCVADYDKGYITPHVRGYLVANAERHQSPLLVDPGKTEDGWRDFGSSQTIFKVNMHQANAFYALGHRQVLFQPDVARSGAELGELVCELSAYLHKQRILHHALIVTLGGRGMAAAVHPKPGRITYYWPATPVPLPDACGAGDVVLASLAVSLANHSTIAEAMAVAILAAGVAVRKRGVAVVTLAELQEERRIRSYA